ncbi:diaminopimelate decarboxylase [Elusimicrobiota bacterium]
METMLKRVNGNLFFDNVSLDKLAKIHGTPLYVYSENAIKAQVNKLKRATGNARVFYAIKANPRLQILKTLKKLGLGVEAVSRGEILRALKTGFKPQDIIYNGNGKTREEISLCLDNGINLLNADALDQLELIEEVASIKKMPVRILLRVKPPVKPATHPRLAVGAKRSKFGFAMVEIKSALHLFNTFKYTQLVGIHLHFGSQMLNAKAFLLTARFAAGLYRTLTNSGWNIQIINLGGGFGVPYKDQDMPLDMMGLKAGYASIFKGIKARLYFEPGRFLVASSGILLMKMLSVKHSPFANIVVVDTAMTENPRYVLYKAKHKIIKAACNHGNNKVYEIVGPVCENSDTFGKYKLPHISPGDLLVMLDTGAYVCSMASNYNSRTRPAEIIISNNKVCLVKKPASIQDIWKNEIL